MGDNQEEPLTTQAEIDKFRAQAMTEEFGDKASEGAGTFTDDLPPSDDDDFMVNLEQDGGDEGQRPNSQKDETGAKGDEGSKDEEDIFAGINPALKSHIEGLEERVRGFGTTEERLKQAERRIGSLQQELNNRNQEGDDDNSSGDDGKKAPTDEEVAAAAASEEAWNELLEEFPEWGKAIDARLAAERKGFEDRIAELVKQNQNNIDPEESKRNTKKINELTIAMEHPTWKNTVKSEDFNEWAAQHPELNPKYASEDPEDAIEVLNLYNEFKKEGTGNSGKKKTAEELTREKREQRLSGSELPDTSPSRLNTSMNPEDMTEEQYREYISKEIWKEDEPE